MSGIIILVSNVQKFRETYRKFSRKSKYSEYVKIVKNDQNFRTFPNILKVRTSVIHILSKYTHSKNAFKTVLARSGAKKNSFLCFGHFLCMTDIAYGRFKEWFRTFEIFEKVRKGTPVDKVGRYENCTEIFVFRLSVFPVHFPEKTRNPETVTETHGLNLNSSQIFLSNSPKLEGVLCPNITCTLTT